MTADLLLYIIAGRESSGFFEVRGRHPDSGLIKAREWFPLGSRAACAEFIESASVELDVYIGVAPRCRREGGKSAIPRAWCLWVDCDMPNAVERLHDFDPRPTLTVSSGTGSNLHAYWALSEPLPPAWLERANRRLAHHLGGDMKATDAARILRPPGTLNHKHTPPVTVRVVHHEAVTYPVVRVVGSLPDPEQRTAPRKARPDVPNSDDPLLGVSADRYYTVLTGRELGRGNVTCPFHSGGKERTPSMRLYGNGTWACWGCAPRNGRVAGGGIYEFAAALWDMDTRGADFLRLRERLTEALQ